VPLSLDRKSQDLPRHAILTADDRTIPPDWQASLAAGLPRVCITTMPCGHSPSLPHRPIWPGVSSDWHGAWAEGGQRPCCWSLADRCVSSGRAPRPGPGV
jgi:hypothetical protein